MRPPGPRHWSCRAPGATSSPMYTAWPGSENGGALDPGTRERTVLAVARRLTAQTERRADQSVVNLRAKGRNDGFVLAAGTAYFPLDDIADGAPRASEHTTRHQDLGPTSWYIVQAGEHSTPRAAWQHTNLPGHASELKDRVAFGWRAMDAFYEEDERIVGHAADNYHRIDIRQTSRQLTVRYQDRLIADSSRPWSCMSPGSRRAGTSRAPTSTNPRSPRPKAGPSARTRAWPATTTSSARAARPGRTPTPGPRSGASAGWSPSSRTSSRCTWTAPGSGLSPARP